MKFLIAIALLTLAVADAVHTSAHTLRGPRFKVGKQYKYEVEFNMTSGVLGLSSQVSAAVIQAEVSIYAKSQREHILKVHNVLSSGSVSAIDNKYGDIPLPANRDLEDRLSTPIKFTLEDGKVKSYTLSNKESLESKKIKKSILRSLQMHIPESAFKELEATKYGEAPVTYNTTENTEFGVHSSHYIITVSPYIDFPSEDLVYNVSRIDNFEAERYPSHKLHHNFQKQGCPEVCRKQWRRNEYKAGCPIGHEPHQSPIKKSYSHEHALSVYENDENVLSPEVISTVEVHFAEMYDQVMEVLLRYRMRRTEVTDEAIEEQSGQQSYSDLEDWESEINENEIADRCSYKKTDEAKVSAKNLLKTISSIIVQGELSETRSYILGEKVILLRDVLSRLDAQDLKEIATTIKSTENLQFANDEEKVKRQIWMDILPLIGTQESVKFIVDYIRTGITEKKVLVWEAKEMLESLPQNIERPDEETISEMQKLAKNTEIQRRSAILHSAIHLSMARVIGEVCGTVSIVRSAPKQKSSSWFSSVQDGPKIPVGPAPCPVGLVSRIVEEVSGKLNLTRKPSEMAIYIETLAHIGTPEVLPMIAEYIYGTAEGVQEFSPKLIDFMKTVAQYALHNVAGKYPDEVLQIVAPVYFNDTEVPRVRTAAFGVLMRCQPPLDILEKVVIHSWFEKSYEVGSFVTSTLETYGNSSLPCMQLTSHRIQTVLPQMRRFDVGVQHAKNYMGTYFDENREFGLEGRLEYTPSNESFIPSAMYKSLSYSLGSLREIVSQCAVNMEGLTQAKIQEKIIDYLNIEGIETIEREDEVFGQGRAGLNYLKPRTVEDLRLTAYSKTFYKSSYYYFDTKTRRDAVRDVAELLIAYLRKTESQYTGYLVKMMMPSSYHTVAIASILPYPVEFQMRQPVILALNIRTAENSPLPPSRKHFDMLIRPSVYLSKLFTHQIKNIGDCKEVGVYHEHKIAITYPFELKYDGIRFPNMTIRYKVPPKSKRILSYHTEAGTYVGKKELETLPSSMEKSPIRTIPTPFKFEREINAVGVPPLSVELHTEDLNLLNARLPRNPMEALDMAVKRILNAGWRYKSINVTVLENEALWTGDTVATFEIKYNSQHIPRFTRVMSPQDSSDESDESPSAWKRWQKQPQEESPWTTESEDAAPWQSQAGDSSWQSPSYDSNSPWESQPEDAWSQPASTHQRSSEEDWINYLKPSEIGSVTAFTKNAKAVSKILNYVLPHMSHVWDVSVTAEPLSSSAYMRMEFNHTYEKNLFSVHTEVAAREGKDKVKYQVSLDHLMGYWNSPDELKYGSRYGQQQAGFLTAISLPHGRWGLCSCSWEKVEIAMRGYLRYESNKKILENEVVDRVEDSYFLPEKHEECLNDVREGKPLSVNCVKAIREYSIFNKLNMGIMWNEELPYSLRQLAHNADTYLKHYFFEHMNLVAHKNLKKGISLKLDYIDKFVDEPVVDLVLVKPSETVTLKRVPAPDGQALSSVYGIYETAMLEATNNTYMPTCVMMENYVKTYDLKTFDFQPKDCHYVLTTHCTKLKNFAVVAHGKKEIYVHIGTNTIVLRPKSGEHYKIQWNGEERMIVDPVVLQERDRIYVYSISYERGHQHIKVVAQKAGMTVLYDGKNVKVQVSPRYKGEMCGLCSEFDGEEVREFRGLDRCLYKDYRDFINSNMIKRSGRCKIEDRLWGDRICDNEPGKVRDDRPVPTLKRNAVVSKGNDVCFSTRAIPVCRDDQPPTETAYESVEFHCLPKRDLTARKMVADAKSRPLSEIERKSVDLVQRIEVPKMC